MKHGSMKDFTFIVNSARWGEQKSVSCRKKKSTAFRTRKVEVSCSFINFFQLHFRQVISNLVFYQHMREKTNEKVWAKRRRNRFIIYTQTRLKIEHYLDVEGIHWVAVFSDCFDFKVESMKRHNLRVIMKLLLIKQKGDLRTRSYNKQGTMLLPLPFLLPLSPSLHPSFLPPPFPPSFLSFLLPFPLNPPSPP